MVLSPVIPRLGLLLALSIPGAAIGQGIDGEILDDGVAPEADAPVLLAEAHLFDTIRKGIAISLAQCDVDVAACDPAVNREELKRVMAKLDNRINLLATRHAETGEADLEAVLLAYAGVRDEYSGFQERLQEIAPVQESSDGEEGFDLFGNAPAPALPAAYNVFEDADSGIRDDEELLQDDEADAAPAAQE